jgi:hypothetical protein
MKRFELIKHKRSRALLAAEVCGEGLLESAVRPRLIDAGEDLSNELGRCVACNQERVSVEDGVGVTTDTRQALAAHARLIYEHVRNGQALSRHAHHGRCVERTTREQQIRFLRQIDDDKLVERKRLDAGARGKCLLPFGRDDGAPERTRSFDLSQELGRGREHARRTVWNEVEQRQ